MLAAVPVIMDRALGFLKGERENSRVRVLKGPEEVIVENINCKYERCSYSEKSVIYLGKDDIKYLQ